MSGTDDTAVMATAGHSHESACLDCGTPLLGKHCHHCGQQAHLHRSLGAFVHDLLHGVFHFEGRIWRTLPLLALRPGKLTRAYIDGKRASYVSPLALFLFSVFLMFTVFQLTSPPDQAGPSVEITGADGRPTTREKVEQRLVGLRADRAALVTRGQSTTAIDEQIDTEQTTLDILAEAGNETTDYERFSDIPALQHAYDAFRANPGLTLYKLQSYAYKYSWALIPISVPFLWLLFPFSRRFQLYDHTVFVTYSLSAMTLLAIVAMLLTRFGGGGAAGLLLLVPPVHIYAQLRGTYGGSRLAAMLRTVSLLIFALVALTLFALLILAQSSH